MCGILGQLKFKEAVDPNRFRAMLDTLAHRGPDGQGIELLANNRVALGHRRLSILDLSEDGRQPMSNEDRTIWLTFNGEIYNFEELREELVAAGHRFRSRTDSEVLVHGYEEWGIEELLSRIKGMFAFGLWDEKQQKLYLVRDRFGIKPVIYYRDDDQFSFASEIKALTRDPALKKELRQDAIADYFIYSYVPHPHTVWQDVYKLRPAHYLTLDLRTGEQHTKRYWSLRVGNRKLPMEEVAARTKELLRQSIREHMVSDVPVGLFLSGGYDSTTALMHMRETGTPVDSFSLGFAGSERSEHLPAAAIARRLDSAHHVRLLEYETDLFPLIERLVRHYDEPFAVSSQLTYHHVAELAAQTHKVVMGGDGGDEVFAGYTWYAQLANERYRLRGLARAALGRRSRRDQVIDTYARQQTGVYLYVRSRDFFDPALAERMHRRAFGYFDRHFSGHRNFIKSIQQLDIDTFMLDNCLQRADMSSMLHSLEVRVPFLDHELLEFVFSLRPEAYFDARQPKKLLYRNLRGKVGDDILNRKKQGFGFQHRNALTGKAYEDFVNQGELRRLGLLTRPVDFGRIRGETAFHLVFLEQWFRLN